MSIPLVLFVFAAPTLSLATETCPEKELVKSGTISGEGGSVGFILGYRWAEGTITLNNNKRYKFKAKGAKAGEMGVSKAQFTGTVYNLEKIEDFPGTFSGVGAGITLYKGLGGASFTNKKCVSINIKRINAKGIQGSPPLPVAIKVELTN